MPEKTLKEIDKDILDKIKKVHQEIVRWSAATRRGLREGQVSIKFFEESAEFRQKIDVLLNAIYEDIMEEEERVKHLDELGRLFESHSPEE